MKAHGIMFHHFHDEKKHIKSQGSIDEKELETMLKYYEEKGSEKGGLRLLTAQEWYHRAITNCLKPEDICLSFDDGLKCQFEIAYPILKKYKMTAFFFVPTQRFVGEPEKLEVYRHFRFSVFQEIDEFYQYFFEFFRSSELFPADGEKRLRSEECQRYLREFAFYTRADRIFRYIRDKMITEQQYHELMAELMAAKGYDAKEEEKTLYMSKQDLRELFGEGNVIGLHSHTHYTALADTDYARQRFEYETNQQILQEIIGKKADTVSYPCNSYNTDTLKLMGELGVRLGFRANREQGYSSPLEMPREDHINIIGRLKDENYGIYK